MTAELKEHELSDATDMAPQSVVRNPGVLIADDMALILTLLKFELESRGFNVWLAVDGDDALDLYRRHRDEIDLVLLDVQMPGLDGPHTLEALQRLNPDVVACFMTGNTGIYTDEVLLDRGASWIFGKPFRPADIADLLQRVVSAPDSTPFVCDWQPPSERKWQPCTLQYKSAPSPS
jgi:CheY-like chemotaxis protein